MNQTQFSRQLIVLRAIINGYTGHARLFNCPTGQELEVRVQTPGGMRALYAAVVERCEDGYRSCPLGALTVDERGQGTGAFSLAGSGVTPEILAIVEQSGDSCMLAMSGFLSGSRNVNWAGVRSAACEAVALNACSGCTPGIQPRDADSAATELPGEAESGSGEGSESRSMQSNGERGDGGRNRSSDRQGHSGASDERQGYSRSDMREDREEREDRDEYEDSDDRDGRSRPGMRDDREDDRDEHEEREDRDEYEDSDDRDGRSRPGMRDDRDDRERRSRSGMRDGRNEHEDRGERDKSRNGNRRHSDERNGSDRTSDSRNQSRRIGSDRAESANAAETAGIDRDCDWPEEIAALAPLFASQPAVTPFAGSRYTFIAVPASEAQPAFFAGIWAANGYPLRAAYAIRGDSPTLQPQGLESFLWRPAGDGGFWTTYIDAMTGQPVSGDY